MACARVRQVHSQCFLYLALISLLSSHKASATAVAGSTPFPLSVAEAAGSPPFPTSLPHDCPNKCGNISIPYPFGIGSGCSRDDGFFIITCNQSTNPPTAILGTENSNIELIDINITEGEVRVYKHIGYRCLDQETQTYDTDESSLNLTYSPYLFSNRKNKFTVIGCGTLAYIGADIFSDSNQTNDEFFSGCLSFCTSSTKGNNGSCNGLGCCQSPISTGLNYYVVQWVYISNPMLESNPCGYAVLLQEDWYKFQTSDLTGRDFIERSNGGAPVVLDWAIRDNGASCQLYGVEKNPSPACISRHSRCYNTSNGNGYLCYCSNGYEGNPYIADGCTDIDECKYPDIYICNGICRNTDGDYDCPCGKGQKGLGKNGTCTNIFPYSVAAVALSSLGGVVLLGMCFLGVVKAYQQLKRHIKEKVEYQRYYNMMHNHLGVFSKKQIEIATNNFDETHVLGVGGQGKVYKGLLENKVVAIKKAKEVEETKRVEFVNEILLLSGINHRNIVKLLGCCLEVKIPMLVYEFVPNGTLFEMLHGTGRSRQISLGTRDYLRQ